MLSLGNGTHCSSGGPLGAPRGRVFTDGAVWRQSWAVWTESSPVWAVWAAFWDPFGPFWSPLGTVLRLSRAVAMVSGAFADRLEAVVEPFLGPLVLRRLDLGGFLG
eukprot:4339753-Pyramimonas_sp.AAC.1